VPGIRRALGLIALLEDAKAFSEGLKVLLEVF